MIYALLIGILIGFLFAVFIDWAAEMWEQGREYRR
jgi:hypothetical protein